MKLKNFVLLFLLLCFVIVTASCDANKKDVKELFKETHEKELVTMINQLKQNAAQIQRYNKYENNSYIEKTEEWNEKIQPLIDRISEHHKIYHVEDSIFSNDIDAVNFNKWIYFKVNSGNPKYMKKYFTACPFCNDYWDRKPIAQYPKSFYETTLFHNLFSNNIIKEALDNLNEKEFRLLVSNLEKLVKEKKAFTVSDDLQYVIWSSEFLQDFEQLKELHLKYHQFPEDFQQEFMSYYIQEATLIDNNPVRRGMEIPIFDNNYTCCPWCRLFADYDLSDNSKLHSLNDYNLIDFGFWNAWGMTEKWNTAREEKKNEIREKKEQESLNYLNVYSSPFVRGELGVELKNPDKCPEILYIPDVIDGISVGEVYIKNSNLLKEVYVPASVKTIGFPKCYNLEKVHLNEGLETLMSGAFIYCYNLKSIHIPDSVKTIGKNAFCNCVSLEEVNLPKSLTTMGSNVFGFNYEYDIYYFEEKQYERYEYSTPGGEREIKRKILNIQIPEDISKYIVFKTEQKRGSFDTRFYTFSNTEKYIPVTTQARIRQIGYDGEF